MFYARKIELCCASERQHFRKYQVVLPEELANQRSVLASPRVFSWKYDFLKALLAKNFSCIPAFVFWSEQIIENQEIIDAFGDIDINWNKVVGYLAFRAYRDDVYNRMEYGDEGVLFCTNGIAIRVRGASAEFYPWLEACTLFLTPTERVNGGGTGSCMGTEAPRGILWCFDVDEENQKGIDALSTVLSHLRSNCLQGVQQAARQYISAYLQIQCRILTQIQTETREDMLWLLFSCVYLIALAASCNMEELVQPVFEEFINSLLIPAHCAESANELISFLVKKGVDISPETRKSAAEAQWQEDIQSLTEMLERCAFLFFDRHFDAAEKYACEILQKYDYTVAARMYYTTLVLRGRSRAMRQWLQSVQELPDGSEQRQLLERECIHIEGYLPKGTGAFMSVMLTAANDDAEGWPDAAKKTDWYNMTALMYAVLFDFPTVYRRYLENFKCDSPIYAVKNVLGQRAIDLLAMRNAGFEFCQACAQMAAAQLKETMERHTDYFKYAKQTHDYGTLLLMSLPLSKSCPNPFKLLCDNPSQDLLDDLENECYHIWNDAYMMLEAQLVLYGQGWYDIDEAEVEKRFPIPVSHAYEDRYQTLITDIFEEVAEELVEKDESLKKDEFETSNEYNVRLLSAISDELEKKIGNVEGLAFHIAEQAKSEVMQDVIFDVHARKMAFLCRRSLLLQEFGWNPMSEWNKVYLDKYDADEQVFRLRIGETLSLRDAKLEIPRDKAKRMAKQYQDGTPLKVTWLEVLLGIHDEVLFDSMESMENWLIEHEKSEWNWDIENSTLLKNIVQASGGLIPKVWAEECDKLCERTTYYDSLCDQPPKECEGQENCVQDPEWRKERNWFLMRKDDEDVDDEDVDDEDVDDEDVDDEDVDDEDVDDEDLDDEDVDDEDSEEDRDEEKPPISSNEDLFRRVTLAVRMAKVLRRRGESLEVFLKGYTLFEKRIYYFVVEAPFNSCDTFAEYDDSWKKTNSGE